MHRRILTALLTLTVSACATTKPAEAPPPETPASQQPQTPAPDPEAFRDTQPKPGTPPDIVLPTFEKAQLDNGLTVIVSTRKELPLVFAGIAFASGVSQEPLAKLGVADLSYRMLLEGAGKRDTVALDNAFADLGVSPALSVEPDGAFVGARVLTRNVDAVMALLADVVLRPTFDAKAFERRKKQQLGELVRRMGDPNFLAQQAYYAAVFGADHPYGHPSGGTPKTVQSLTLADAKNFYVKNTGPRAAALIMTGDVTLPQAVEWAKKYFGGWKGGAVAPKPPPAPPAPPRQQVRVVPKPGLEQTVVLVGRPGLAAGHADEYPLELATTVFGGFFGSRLNMNIREDKGYSYGANAHLGTRLGVGPLTANAAVRQNVTGPALNEFMKELAGIKTNPITEKELAAAREGLIRAFPGAFETVEGLGGSAAQLFFHRRPMDEFKKSVEGLRDASAAEVQRVAEAYLDPAAMQVVLVGDPLVIQEQVTPLNLGKLTLVETPDTAPAPKAATP
ncbi:insulinase family protein [Corallococcus praedator]|uniref:Insulinase family protein n=1 Tax=Corallococcus praedator TaxID=2316724 RepID=A0ABX9Q9I7_9BACT|nr:MULTISPECIES: pitrilysin family protein [Corallococcus]RKH31738.1 insulinase family protein [Corallococcus sp. CA031C]RKH95439.1 insulinase family protein [Corallococcus praedator]